MVTKGNIKENKGKSKRRTAGLDSCLEETGQNKREEEQ